jgi:hypothetical protein
MEAGERPNEKKLDEEGELAQRESAVGSNPGAPTWPIPVPDGTPMPPPVGLNWGEIAQRFGADPRVLMHGCYIVLQGEFVPETGYFIDPRTLRARRVDVGQRVLEHGYLIGRLTADEFRVPLDLLPDGGESALNPVIRTAKGPIIGLFSDRRAAERCRDSLLSGALGSGVTLQDGPLGFELRVDTAEIAGRVATTIASHAGAIISVAGVPVQGGAGSAASG